MLTATASRPTSSVRLVLFVLRGVLVSLALFGLLRLEWVEVHAVLPFTLAEAALAVRLFGVPALPIDVTLACSGADAISLCLGAILAFPAPWRRRVTGAQMDVDTHLTASHVDQVPILADTPTAAYPDAIDRDVDKPGLERCARRADRRQHATPVRILAVNRALEQVAA